ncbi:hypothetical protein MMC10_004874 [Thelotrema lepadinum]|nr:hypothetical protein [Thelotrema lepadinum]
MYFLWSFISIVAISAALPSAAAPTTTSFSYPYELNTTAPDAFYLHIASANPLIDGRNVQLRQTNGKGSPQIVVVDATSPVLQAKMENGVIYSENRTLENQLYDLGPVSHLKNVSTTISSSLQEFYFQNATSTTKATGNFMLELIGSNAVYGLYHKVPLEVVNGFIICQKGDYWQLYYNTYLQTPPNYDACEYVGVQGTIAPDLNS